MHIMEILLIDDERTLRNSLKDVLAAEGFAVRTARDGLEALKKLAERRPDLILLDVAMPKMNGFAVCAEIRKRDRILPILFLTASESEADQLRAIGLGADDYIVKTTDDSVLIARIRRALERVDSICAEVHGRHQLRLGSLTVDFDAMTVEGHGVSERLTRMEADFLQLLASVPGKCYPLEEIFQAVRGAGSVGEDGAVYASVYRLKRKLGRYGELIDNVRGGYRLIR